MDFWEYLLLAGASSTTKIIEKNKDQYSIFVDQVQQMINDAVSNNKVELIVEAAGVEHVQAICSYLKNEGYQVSLNNEKIVFDLTSVVQEKLKKEEASAQQDSQRIRDQQNSDLFSGVMLALVIAGAFVYSWLKHKT
jgi:phage-related holin